MNLAKCRCKPTPPKSVIFLHISNEKLKKASVKMITLKTMSSWAWWLTSIILATLEAESGMITSGSWFKAIPEKSLQDLPSRPVKTDRDDVQET
jgi:hypothetical protein